MSTMQISDLKCLEVVRQPHVVGGRRLVSVAVDAGTFVDIRLSVGRRSADLDYGLATGVAAGVSFNGIAIASFNFSAIP